MVCKGNHPKKGLIRPDSCRFMSTQVLLFRLWEGNALVQCGRQSPFVASKCVCGGTLPYICWISESISAAKMGELSVVNNDSFTAHLPKF